ncbi:MAG: methyltransferase [Cyanobacteria bacterium]|nr:methyltransferase [Cyanobacteriota bacterium]
MINTTLLQPQLRGDINVFDQKKTLHTTSFYCEQIKTLFFSGEKPDPKPHQDAPRGKIARQKWIALVQRIKGRPILGFVPTPQVVVEKLLKAADIQPHMTVLEPSAGKGNIAARLRNITPHVSVVEMDPDLQEYLTLRGLKLIAKDALAIPIQYRNSFDRIVMNPPFEDRRDIQHVINAYQYLKPGGRLVAVMSENSFRLHPGDSIPYQKLLRSFQCWLRSLGAKTEALPQGTFIKNERPTPIDTRMVVLQKPIGGETATALETLEKDYFDYSVFRKRFSTTG